MQAPALIALLKDFDKDVRKAAVETLGKLDSADLATRAAAFVTWLKDARELHELAIFIALVGTMNFLLSKRGRH